MPGASPPLVNTPIFFIHSISNVRLHNGLKSIEQELEMQRRQVYNTHHSTRVGFASDYGRPRSSWWQMASRSVRGEGVKQRRSIPQSLPSLPAIALTLHPGATARGLPSATPERLPEAQWQSGSRWANAHGQGQSLWGEFLLRGFAPPAGMARRDCVSAVKGYELL